MTLTPDENDLFESFLATGTVRRRTVTVYADQAAQDELNAIASEADSLSSGPETIDETSRVDELKRRWDDAFARYEASKATFVLVRLEEPIREQVIAMHVDVAPPRKISADASKKAKAAYARALDDWRPLAAQVVMDRGDQALAFGIESMETAKGRRVRALAKDGTVSAPVLTLEDLRRMFAAPYGPQWKALLTHAFNEVSKEATEPARPFSLAASGSDPA